MSHHARSPACGGDRRESTSSPYCCPALAGAARQGPSQVAPAKRRTRRTAIGTAAAATGTATTATATAIRPRPSRRQRPRQGRRRDDPQPLPRRRPDAGDRRDNPGRIRRRQRPDPARSRPPTTSRPGPRAWPTRSSTRSPTWSACRRWRSGAPRRSTRRPDRADATTVRYDYLPELLAELNKGRTALRSRRRPGRVRPRGAGRRERGARRRPAARLPDAEINGRLTMRDVILARRGAGVQTWNAAGRQLRHPARTCRSSGQPLPIKRGWTATDAKVRGSHAVPLRQHPPGGVPAADPRRRRRMSWSRRAVRRRASCRSSCSATSTPTTTRSTVRDTARLRSPARGRAWSSAAPTTRSAAASNRACSQWATAAA